MINYAAVYAFGFVSLGFLIVVMIYGLWWKPFPPRLRPDSFLSLAIGSITNGRYGDLEGHSSGFAGGMLLGLLMFTGLLFLALLGII